MRFQPLLKGSNRMTRLDEMNRLKGGLSHTCAVRRIGVEKEISIAVRSNEHGSDARPSTL